MIADFMIKTHSNEGMELLFPELAVKKHGGGERWHPISFWEWGVSNATWKEGQMGANIQ